MDKHARLWMWQKVRLSVNIFTVFHQSTNFVQTELSLLP